MITRLLKTLFDYLFPPSCIVCSQQTREYAICDTCAQRLPLTREFRKPWLFSLYSYRNESVTTCVHYLKNYPDQLLLQKLLAQKHIMISGWTMGVLRTHACNSIVLIPTPIHRSRFLDRGYNQSELIAREFQKILARRFPYLPITIRTDIVQKNKITQKQALITDRAKRLQNIKNAFTTTGREAALPAHALIIIIDDVTTTGGTLQEIHNLFTLKNIPAVAFTLAH